MGKTELQVFMSNFFAKTPRPKPRETLTSFLSRLAASKGVGAKNFASDMGVSFKRVLNLDEEALSRLLKWGRLTAAELNELLSWTGEASGVVRMRFRGELFVSRAIRNPVMRGCPFCLQKDAKGHGGSPHEVMVMRGDWLLREVVMCIEHERPLVPLWRDDRITEREDIGARLMEISDKILEGKLDPPNEKLSPYDLWLDRRLEDGIDGTWLANHSLYAASTVCRLLGAAILDMKIADISDNTKNLRAAQLAGFEIARQGAQKVRTALDALAARATGVQDQPNKAFRQLFAKLNIDYLEEDAFAPFRQILRDCILAHWPIGAGEIVLGLPVPERLLHSLQSAATETGIGVKVLEQFLTEAGAFKSENLRIPGRKIFDANEYSALLVEIPKLVGPTEMQTAMGVTRAELISLERDGLLTPRTRVPTVKFPWRAQDGLALLKELQSFAKVEIADDTDWESIQLSSKRTGESVGEIVEGIRSGSIRVALKPDVQGYHGIWVRKSDVGDRRRTKLEIASEHTATVRATVSAAGFARSIGLREKGLFSDFLEAGHVSSTHAVNPKSRQSQFRMNDDDIRAFHRNFMTLTTMQAEFRLHRNVILMRLKARKISQFESGGRAFGAIWSRHAVAALFAGCAP